MIMPLQSQSDISAAPLQFSCTLVYKPYDASTEVQDSHTFLDLSLDPLFFCSRSGSMSIHINTLLASIQAHALKDANYHQNLPPAFYSIFSRNNNRDSHFLAQFNIATSRVPDFGKSIKSPTNGYRYLGNLGSFSFQYTLHSLSQRVSSQEEVIAVGSTGRRRSTLPHISAFLEVWEPFGIDLDTHFIIILHPAISPNMTTLSSSVNPISPPTYRTHLPPIHSAQGLCSATPSSQGSPSPLRHGHVTTPISPMQRETISHSNPTPLPATSFHDSPPISTPQSRSLSPLSAMLGPGYNLHEGLEQQFAPAPAFENNGEEPSAFHLNHDLFLSLDDDYTLTTTGVSIALPEDGVAMEPVIPDGTPDFWPLVDDVNILFLSCNISDTEKEAASFTQQRGSFLPNILNFYALRDLLLKMGFNDILNRNAAQNLKNSKSLLNQVVQSLRWNPHSLAHKIVWFRLATKMAQMSWNQYPTSNCKHSYLLY